MYFEFESLPTAMSSSPQMSPMTGLSQRHRRLSSSTQSLRQLIDSENVIENITPSHCDLYLITRKKLSQINANTIKQSPDLRREVLLTSIHRNITSKPTITANELTASSAIETTTTASRDKSVANDCQPMITNSDQQFKYVNMSATTSTSTTTMANASSGTRMMTSTSSTTRTTPSTIKKRNLAPAPTLSTSDYEEEWTATIKRLKVVHGLDGSPFDVSMDSEFDSGYCDTDLNDLTNNFHSLKTPFS